MCMYNNCINTMSTNKPAFTALPYDWCCPKCLNAPLPADIISLRPQNTVYNATLGAKVDAQDVCEVISGRLEFDVFPATHSVCRQSGGVSVSIFNSGELVISGSRSAEQAINTTYLLGSALNRELHRNDLRPFNLKRQNMVFSCDLGFSVNVDKLIHDADENGMYNPGTFEGGHLKTCDQGKNCLGFPKKKERQKKKAVKCPGMHAGFVIFPSGKVLTTMLKCPSQKKEAERRLRKVFQYQFGNEYHRKKRINGFCSEGKCYLDSIAKMKAEFKVELKSRQDKENELAELISRFESNVKVSDYSKSDVYEDLMIHTELVRMPSGEDMNDE